jgi:hypothetical protein
MTYALKVEGLRGFLAASDAAGPATKKLVRDDLRRAVEPVRVEATRLLAELSPEAKQRYGISVRKIGVISVEGRRRKTTGARPDWGKTQMREVLHPAAENEQDTVVATLEREAAATFARLFTRRL